MTTTQPAPAPAQPARTYPSRRDPGRGGRSRTTAAAPHVSTPVRTLEPVRPEPVRTAAPVRPEPVRAALADRLARPAAGRASAWA
ncbi:hypothetical protein ACQFYA_00115 [Promicromonospora sp. Marseille-Q5078]